jgi:hypothetical protein
VIRGFVRGILRNQKQSGFGDILLPTTRVTR